MKLTKSTLMKSGIDKAYLSIRDIKEKDFKRELHKKEANIHPEEFGGI